MDGKCSRELQDSVVDESWDVNVENAPGPDRICLNELWKVWAEFLLVLSNAILYCGELPGVWK